MHSTDVLQVMRVAAFVMVCLAILLWLAVIVARMLKRSRLRDESANRIRELRKERLARLLELADRVEAAPNEKERQRLYREAEAICDDSDEKPFMLDVPDDRSAA